MTTPRPYYFGIPTKPGQPLPGSAPASDNLWLNYLNSTLRKLPEGAFNVAQDIGNAIIETGPFRDSSELTFKSGQTFADKNLRDQILAADLQNKERGNRTLYPNFMYEARLPFGDGKTLAEAATNTLTGVAPFDLALGAGFASRAGKTLFSPLAAKAGEQTNIAKKIAYGALPEITKPILNRGNFADRFAAELAFENAIKFATESGGPIFGLGTPIATFLTARGLYGLGKKSVHAIPSLEEYLKNPEAVNVVRPSRLIPTQDVPSIAGGAVDPKPSEFYGENTFASATGNSPDSRFAGGGEYQRMLFKYKLVDGNNILTSNDPYSPTFELTPDYPTLKQPRNRFTDPDTKVDEEASLLKIAKNLRPNDVLEDTKRFDTGIPIIGENHVESGNKRVMAIKLAARDYPDRYQEYLFGNNLPVEDPKAVPGLRNILESYGIPKTELDKFDLSEQVPLLVRERQTVLPDDQAIDAFVRDANDQSSEAFSSFEEAAQLAESWNDGLLTRIIPVGKNIRTTLQASSNQEIINAYRQSIIRNPNAKNWFRKGQLTEEGTNKLVQGLRVKVFGQDNADFLIKNIDILPDDQTKSLFNAIDEALPQLAVIKGKTQKFSTANDYDISNDIISAIQRFRSIKDRARDAKQPLGKAVDEYLMQDQLFADNLPSSVERLLLDLFNGHGKGSATSKDLSSVFSKYEQLVENNLGQGNMFGSNTKEDLLASAIRSAVPEGTEISLDNAGRVAQALDEQPQYQAKESNDVNFDKDVDDPLPKKQHEEVKKEVKKEGNYNENEDPTFGQEKKESDLSSSSSPVTKKNIEDPIIRTTADDNIKMTTKAKARHENRKEELVLQREAIVLEKDINNPNDVTRIITSPAFKQMLGDQSVKLGYSARDKAINSVIKQAENFKIPMSKLNFKHREGNLIDGMKDFYDRTQDIINSKVPKIATTIDYRIRNAFSINKDGTVNKLPLLEKQVTDAKGKVVLKKGKPIIKQFKPTIQDIAARYPEYVGALNSKQIRALESVQDELLPTSQLWNELPEIQEKYNYSKHLIDIRPDIQDGGFYLPRGGALEDGMLDALPKEFNTRLRAKAWNKTAKFDSMGEAIANGYVYDDIKLAVSKLSRSVMQQHTANILEISSKNFRDASGQTVWKSIDDLIKMEQPELGSKVKAVKKEWARLVSLKNLLELRTQGIVDTLLDETTRNLDEIDLIISKKLYVIKAGPNKDMTRKEIIQELNKLKKQLVPLKRQYRQALKRLEPGYGGYIKLQDLGYKELSNLYLDENAADSFNAFFKDLSPSQRRNIGKGFIQTFNGVYLMTKATFDNSGPGIQGITGIVTNPKAWLKAVKANMETLVKNDKNAYAKALIEFDEQAGRKNTMTSNMWINEGLIQNEDIVQTQIGTTRINEGLQKKVYDGWEKLPFNRAFTTFGNIYRLRRAASLLEEHMARGLTIESMQKDGTLRVIAETANKLSGTMNVSRRYRKVQDLGVIFLFAPRYYATRLRNFYKFIKGTANPFTKDQESKILARELQQYIFFASLLTITWNASQGRETDLNPVVRDANGKWRKNGNFMTMKIGGKDRSLLGAVLNVPFHIFNLTSGLTYSAINGDLGEAYNTAINAVKSTGSGAAKLSIDILSNKEWNGTPIRNTKDSAGQQTIDFSLYLLDAFSPFSFAQIGDSVFKSVEDTQQFLQSEKKAHDLGILVKDYGVNSLEAGAEFGGLLSSENTYLDVLIQETKDAGYDWTRLEPHQKRDFKEIVQEKYAKNKEGLARMVGNAFGRSSESIDSPYQIIQQERIDSQKRYLTYLERGYKNDRLDFYGPKDFAKDARDADENYYQQRQGIIISQGDPFADDNSFEETDENILALEQYYDLVDIYYDKELKETDVARYKIQEALLDGQEVELKDGSVIGDWSEEQREYVLRNINDQYYDPDVLAKMLEFGKLGVFPLRYWYQDRIKSENARKRFKDAGSPGSALDPNKVFFWDSRTFNLRVQPPEGTPTLNIPFLDRVAPPTNPGSGFGVLVEDLPNE